MVGVKIGTRLIRAAIGIAAVTALGYAEYRLNGGPPIRELRRQLKQQKRMNEIDRSKMITMEPGQCTVR